MRIHRIRRLPMELVSRLTAVATVFAFGFIAAIILGMI